MLKIKKVLCLCFGVFLLAFSLLLPFRNIKKDNLITSSGADVQLQIQKGYYLFKLTSDSTFYFPDFDFTINNVNISFANPNGQYVTNANKIVYTASNQTLKYEVFDYVNNVLIAEGVVLNNGSWVTTYSIQSRIIFFNENILVDADIWNFFDKCTTKQNTHNQWSILTFNLLGLNCIGKELNFINSHNEYSKFRFYLLDTDLTIEDNISNDALYCNNDNFNNVVFLTHNGYFYINGFFNAQTLHLASIYTLDLSDNYYFYTLANSRMPYLQYYISLGSLPINFTIYNDDYIYNNLTFNDNRIATTLNDKVINIASFPDNSVTHFNWLYENYNFLIMKFELSSFNNVYRSDILKFIYDNFTLATNYDYDVINNKNNTLEMLKKDYTLLSLFTSIFDSSLIFVKSLFNFNFFGFNLFYLFTSILTFALVIIVYRFLKGGSNEK